MNPTLNFPVGNISALPFVEEDTKQLEAIVQEAINLASQTSIETETTHDFVAPPMWSSGTQDIATRQNKLATIEQEIDEHIYKLYGISAEDRAAVKAELADMAQLGEAESVEATTAEEDEIVDVPLTDFELAQRWLSYALGVALGRFQPGVEGAIGRGEFAPDVAAKLRALADEDGIGLIEPGHPDDLGARVTRALELMHGEDAAHAIIATATGGRALHTYLIADFYREHVRQYRKRPVYWLLQSPGRKYSLLLFHERLTGDSLPLILGNRYVGGKINQLRGRLAELQSSIAQQRRAERERDAAADLLTDAEEFARRIRAVLDQLNEHGEAVGWLPEIDDGVLLNLAPLHTLIPAWAAEPKKAWQALERGDYDWAHTAMRYWPDRVLAKCKTNKSFAIAHGVE